ncbi:MAG: MmgE/PrpD family protein [Candidatus Zixiibacteriota bacterium]
MEKYYANILSEFIYDLDFDKIPSPVLQKAKVSILDNLGLAVGGSDSKATQAVLSVVRLLNGPKESTVFRFGDQLSANYAVLANGTMTHSNDFTDTILTIVTHCGPVVVPTAIAMAEREKLDGKALLTLVVLGYDIAARVGLAINSKPSMVHHKKGFHPTSTCGVFGAAAIAGKALGLKPDKIAHALGIAGSSSSGLCESLTGPTGADTSRTHPGKAGHDGILAALLAKSGLTGPHSVFEGRDGFLHAYSEADQFLPHLLVENLGESFKIMDVAIKYHNGTHAIASSADALQEIVAKYQILPEDVGEIRAFIPTMHAFIGGSDQEAMYAPPTYIKAQMSLPYTLAITLLDGELFLEQYSPEKLSDQKTLSLARKVKITADQEMDRMQNEGKWPSRIQVVTKSGNSYEAFVEYPKGSPQNPLTDLELQRKFNRLSGKSLNKKQREGIIEAVNGLETLKEVTALTRLMIQLIQ